MTAIAKRDKTNGDTRSLIGHCQDVALAAAGLLAAPVTRARLESACGQVLTPVHQARLTVLAGLHQRALTRYQPPGRTARRAAGGWPHPTGAAG